MRCPGLCSGAYRFAVLLTANPAVVNLACFTRLGHVSSEQLQCVCVHGHHHIDHHYGVPIMCMHVCSSCACMSGVRCVRMRTMRISFSYIAIPSGRLQGYVCVALVRSWHRLGVVSIYHNIFVIAFSLMRVVVCSVVCRGV